MTPADACPRCRKPFGRLGRVHVAQDVHTWRDMMICTDCEAAVRNALATRHEAEARELRRLDRLKRKRARERGA